MNKRLLQFIDAENLSQSQFADILGVARASISHILSGRNKPGYDFIESIMLHFPSLNIEWLITGQGKMYKSLSGSSQPNKIAPEPVVEEDDLFANLASSNQESEASYSPVEMIADQQSATVAAKVQTAAQTVSPAAPAQKVGKAVSKLIIFYNDGTYQDVIVA